MKFWGILGRPVRHSFSPIIFNHIFHKYNIAREYIHFEVEDQLLEDVITSMGSRNIEMLNVTHPFKNKILSFCDELEDVARDLFSVNLIYYDQRKIKGFNTDWYGAYKTLEMHRLSPKTAIILGSGGAARSIAYALYKMNPDVRLWVVSRNPAYKNPRWRYFADLLKDRFHLIDYKDLELIVQDKELIINCTPLGLSDHRYSLPTPIQILPKKMVLWDLIYNPIRTEWLKRAENMGFRVINGLEMLVYQAELGYRIVLKRDDFPVEEIMKILQKQMEYENK
jgi:shikimate dehydrogenase